MENTKENKARFFGQYLLQRVFTYPDEPNVGFTFVNLTYLEKILFTEPSEEYYLTLKSLTEISDKDALKIAKIFHYNKGKHRVKEGKSILESLIRDAVFIASYHRVGASFDYLRSKGYALPFMDLSVEKMIEYGWIKLTK